MTTTKKTAADALRKTKTKKSETPEEPEGEFGRLLSTIGSIEEGKSSITVALWRISDGPVRVSITRTFVTTKGETKHGKLGRLNADTAMELAPLLTKAAQVAKGL